MKFNRKLILIFILAVMPLADAGGLPWSQISQNPFFIFGYLARTALRVGSYVNALIPITSNNWTFQNVPFIYSTNTVFADPDTAIPIPRGDKVDSLNGITDEIIDYSYTTALIVLHEGKVRYEEYFRGIDASTQWIYFSISKSVISMGIGAAIGDGIIDSVDDMFTKYLPDLEGTAYDGVSIENVLRMASGVRWDEDNTYFNPFYPGTAQFALVLSSGWSLKDYVLSAAREFGVGECFNYNSLDTQVLALLLIEVTGMGVSEWIQEKVWKPMGAEDDAYYILDESGVEFALGGLAGTARDIAKFVEVVRNDGRNANGVQILPESYVQQAKTSLDPPLEYCLYPGEDQEYGYQIWKDGEGYYFAGIFDQYAEVCRNQQTVVVSLSSNPCYFFGDCDRYEGMSQAVIEICNQFEPYVGDDEL